MHDLLVITETEQPSLDQRARTTGRATENSAGADVLAELGLSTLLLFVVVTAIRGIVGSASPIASQSIWLRVAAVGVVIGITLVVLLRTRWGAHAHLNPAITIAFWILGIFPGRRVAAYLVVQIVGAFAGAVAARLLWGPTVDEVRYGAVAPDPSWSPAAVFTAEAGVMFVIVLVVAALLPNPRTAATLPVVLGVITAAVIAALGPLSGGSGNPIRQLAPAVLGGATTDLWIYLVAPIAGAAAAALLVRLLHVRRARR
jgi:glycerol uptake facilitator-like aquaporin